ncbi:hypothetical protein F5J12DRAFT_779943 [Pisolithus orientalis]|uniref:uncharacterized protein n=1 Tax=Pisolithus orientalis TaxID=936130 RepID=UPI0022256A42|nr:uncharacterized protein F5J12DRAFT_779943 [Pisolithus orientalis]KAI6030923.1 hypothetical protein F5J12DRAFT_779943 [Pisolithus orientalis]
MRLPQLAFLVMPLATLVVGGTVSRNAEGLGGLTERQTCLCSPQAKVCDVTLPNLCCSGVCASAANSILLNAGTCSALHALRTATAAVVAALAPMVVLTCVCWTVIPNTKIHLGAKEFNGSYGYGVHEKKSDYDDSAVGPIAKSAELRKFSVILKYRLIRVSMSTHRKVKHFEMYAPDDCDSPRTEEWIELSKGFSLFLSMRVPFLSATLAALVTIAVGSAVTPDIHALRNPLLQWRLHANVE